MPANTPTFRKYSRSWLTLLTAVTVCLPFATARDAKSQDEDARSAEDQQPEESRAKENETETDPFAVPDGTPEELFEFINDVKRAQPKSREREQVIAFFVGRVNAVVAATDKILEAKPDEELEVRALREKFSALSALTRIDPSASERLTTLAAELADDERPAIQKLAGAELLKARGAAAANMSEGEQEAFLSDLFSYIETHGLDRATYSLASGIARSLGYDSPQTAAAVYEQLAEAMAKSDDEALNDRAEKMIGAARRLRLPGNFMELQGVTAKGEPFDWSEYRGKVVLVDFWASWCGPCRAEVPNMKANLEKYGDAGFAIVGINLDRTAEAREQYVEKEELTWTNLVAENEGQTGWSHPMADYYGVTGIPTAILVDREGKVISLSARGRELDRLLAEQLGETEEPNDDAAESTKE